jgi:CheY-like chemotaxis protein
MDGKKVMVIDDDDAILEVMRDILEDEGYRVATAANGREALERLRADVTRPSLILLDLMMPVMDGWAFRSEQSRDPELDAIPVIVLSADANVRSTADKLQVSGYLRKPIGMQELLDVLAEHCRAG